MLILLTVFLFLLTGSFYAYIVSFHSPKKDRERLPAVNGHQYDPYRPEMSRIFRQLKDRPCEFVSVRSQDGLLLSGRYYHVQDGAPLDICFHGYRSSAFTDFSGGSELSFQMGHNMLLVDQRSHGKSQGRCITFGIKERLDVPCWVDYAVNRFGPEVRITLYGVSMGGATVLMASELPLPKNVKAIVADCPFSSPVEVIAHVGKSMSLPPFLTKPFAVLGAALFGGFNLLACNAARSVEKATVPILILHGEADTYVPSEMSNIVSHNPTLITRYTFPGAVHAICYLHDTPRYQRLVTEFLSDLL